MMNNLMNLSCLLDSDNYILGNKSFTDLMWHIAKEKMTSIDAKGRSFITAKSYVIRNSGVMFQLIFSLYFNNDKTNKYEYNGELAIKIDFEDWWNLCRLTDKEVSTANKFLIDTKLIQIQRIGIRDKGSEVMKYSNCYILNSDELSKYLNNMNNISREIYFDKVVKVREENIRTSIKNKKR